MNKGRNYTTMKSAMIIYISCIDSCVKVQAINDEYTLWATILNDTTIAITNRYVYNYYNSSLYSYIDIVSNNPSGLRPSCSCGIHMAWSSARLRMINDSYRNNLFMSAIKKVRRCRPHPLLGLSLYVIIMNFSNFPQIISRKLSYIMCVSDGSLLPIMCSQIGGNSSLKKVTMTIQRHVLYMYMFNKYV